MTVGAGSAFAAAPAFGLHVDTPESFLTGEPVRFETTVENIGDAPFSGPVTVMSTFPGGIAPTTPELVVGERETAKLNCSKSGQTSTCNMSALGKLTGEGILPGGWFSLRYTVQAEPGADPTGVYEASAEGGGAFEPASGETTIYIGPPLPFGIRFFNVGLTNRDLSSSVQAGSAPATLTTEFDVTSVNMPLGGAPYPFTAATEQFRNTIGRDPAGVISNPYAMPMRCTGAQLGTGESGEGCPPESQVGFVRLFNSDTVPVYLMETPPGTPEVFGFTYSLVSSLFRAELRPDYGLDIANRNAVISLPLTGVDLTLWGVPADPSHDTQRGSCLRSFRGQTDERCPSEAPLQAFLRMPTSCPDQPLGWEIETDSYVHPGVVKHAFDTTPAPVGCNQLEFTPTMEARSTTNVADTPSGIDFHLHLPQNDDPVGLAEANLKETAVTLPPGVTLNPASANGLGSCGSSQIGLATAIGQTPIRFSQGAPNCPDPSRLGSVEIETPLVDHPLRGPVFLASPYDNPFNTPIALYFTVTDPKTGIVLKIPARVSPDPTTGQVKVIVDEAPQLPFEDFRVNLDPGPHASLRTPAACGSFASTSLMTPWTTPEGPDARPSDRFQIVTGANGSACSDGESGLPSAVSFEAGTLNPSAGAYTPFTLKVVRRDGTQPLRLIDTTLPPGLLGRLTGISYCSDSQISAAAANSGSAERASPSCPASSRVGGVDIGTGAGPSPFYAKGDVYLAGAYRGAPYSMAVVVPAVAGPFDLGTVVVRVAIYVDPATTQIHAVGDPLPTILRGIPLDVRSVAIHLDRDHFTVNPTSCDPMSVTGVVDTVFDRSVAVSSPFQVGDCADLPLSPKFGLQLAGGLGRNGHPTLRAALRFDSDEARIAAAALTLPAGELLDLDHIRALCSRDLPAQRCPHDSQLGWARFSSSLIDTPIEGPIYLRTPGQGLPRLSAELHGENGLRLVLQGKTSASNRRLSLRLQKLPDIPLTGAVITFAGGRRGIFVNSKSLCAAGRGTAIFTAQSGQRHSTLPRIRLRGHC